MSTRPRDEDQPMQPVRRGNRIFVVYGHDEEMKQAVARVLETLGIEPIILQEEPNSGRTIIEKFSDYSDASAAIVLISPDDVGYSIRDGADSAKRRARQNVILELGFFLGKLGRDRVFVLCKQEQGELEIPSDYSGILYTPYDSPGRWQLELVKELQAVGFNVDANILTLGKRRSE